MNPRLRVECCDCHTILGYKPCDPAQDGKVSHGYCKPCFQKTGVEITKEIEEEWGQLRKTIPLMGKTVFYRFLGTVEQGTVWYDDGKRLRVCPMGCDRKEYGPWIDYGDLVFL